MECPAIQSLFLTGHYLLSIFNKEDIFMEKELVKVEYVIPQSMQEEIAQKIAHDVKNTYYLSVGKAVSEKIIRALEEDGFTCRVAEAVLKKIKMSEQEYVEGVSKQVKDALMETTGIISREVLKKVQEKVQSYGFIQIGSKSKY
jgi:hypothetical protein